MLFASYNGFAALAAIVIPATAAFLGCRKCHSVNLALGGLSLIAFYFILDPQWLLVPMIGVGVAWASILSLPYVLLSNAAGRSRGAWTGVARCV